MKRMIDNKEFNELKKDVNDINEVVEAHTTDYVITSVVVEDGAVLGSQVKDVKNDVTYNLPLGSQVEANPVLEGGESELSSIEIDGTKYGIGGGKQSYEHNVKMVYSQSGQQAFNISFKITNDNSNALTKADVISYLASNECNSRDNSLDANGQFVKTSGSNDYHYICQGVYVNNNNFYMWGSKIGETSVAISETSKYENGISDFKDKVIPL